MSKMRVHELAKELGRANKEILGFLAEKGMEVKSHMSMLEEEQVELVRKRMSSRPAAKKEAEPSALQTEKQPAPAGADSAKAHAGSAETAARPAAPPKKKNITRIFRSQNSRTGIQKPAGMRTSDERPSRPASRPAAPGTRPAAPGTRPAAAGTRPAAPGTRPAAPGTRPAAPGTRPAAAGTRPAQRPEGREDAQIKTQAVSQAQAQTRAETQPKPQTEAEKPQSRQTAAHEETPARAKTDAGALGRERYDAREGRDNRGGRSFGERDVHAQGRDSRGGRGFSGKDGRDAREGRDNRGGRGFGERDGRTQGRSQNARGLSIPQPDMGSKPVTKESRIRADKEKDRDKYNKHDRFERQERNQGRSNAKNGSPAKSGKTAGKFIKPVTPPPVEKKEDEIRTITLPDRMTIRELADILKVQAAAIVKKLFLQGTMVTVNHEIEFDLAEEIALEYNCIAEHEVKVDVIAELLKEEEDAQETLVARPPVVCVMGHVDHGKTSLLDAIRNTHVIAKEAGGITQHIGAYTDNVNGQRITFLDTPGHEAFTAMRMRGANATDIAILVVAADDGVMPQTIEAINHAKAAETQIVVAINKIDKPGANVERVKQELSEHGLVPEDWGGDTVFVPVSAHTHEGLDNLLEMLLLTAEVAELKANPNRKARGLVIEAELDKGKGPVATVLVQKGTLHVGDAVAAGSCYGKVRAMMDDKGRRVKEADPSTPVEILGLSDVPNAGEVFVACENEKEARNFAETFISESRERLLEETKSRMSLDDLFSQIQAGNLKELGIIVKADVQGSVEAVKQSLLKLSNDEVAVKIIHGGVGAINESDVSLASASNAIIIGFNVRPDAMAKASASNAIIVGFNVRPTAGASDAAADADVDLRMYRVIYDAIADVEAAMKGMLDPVYEEKVIGHAEVRQTFKASGVGTIAGSYVLDGVFQRNCSVRITREGELIYEGALASLKRFKDDVKEVRAGYECGLVFEKFNDVKEFDQIEAYIMVEVPR